MESSTQLAKRFKGVLLHGKWIANTNYKDQLDQLNWKQATTKIGSLNTIASLSFHINYYMAGIIEVFEGRELKIRDKYSFDMPPIASEQDWKQLRDEMWNNAERFAKHIKLISKEQMETDFVNEKYGTYRRNIEGVVEHSYYHLGQIVIIAKLVKEQDLGN